MAIRVIRNAAGNCVNFLGSSNPVYWNACLSAVVDSAYSDRINIINDIRTVAEGATIYEFFQVPYTDFEQADGTAFTSASEAATYITAQANVASNTGSFVLSDNDTLNFSLDSTDTTILVDNGDAYAVNTIQAVANNDGHIDIVKHTTHGVIFGGLRVANAQIAGDTVTQDLATAVNELNSLFTQTASAGGSAPVITSPTTVNLTQGETLNYELTATGGVAFEWVNIPQGITTVDGNNRKLIGGSGLVSDTYTITARAINYYGVDEVDIDLVISAPSFANTKSLQFSNFDYLSANASSVQNILGRSGNGSGSADAWTVAFYFKPSSSNNNSQYPFYYGSSDVNNGNHIRVRYMGTSAKNFWFEYGSSYNYLRHVLPNNTFTDNTWHHVMITYDGGTTGASSGSINDYHSRFTIFVDGVTPSGILKLHGNNGNSTALTGQNFHIARYNQYGYLQQNTKIDEFAIWDSDQSSNVASIYNSGSPHDLSLLGTAPNHWWRTGDGDTYPTVSDNIGSVDFTMNNMTAADIVNDVPA